MAVDPFVAEIRIFPFTFAPSGWAKCNGQLLSIAQNTALFSLLGTTYGGDGKTTFALPDLLGRAPLGWGQGPGLSERVLGEVGGAEYLTLLLSEIPAHAHTLRATSTPADVSSPTASTPLARSSGKPAYHASDAGNTTAAPETISITGGDQPHNNLMPYLCFNVCIALQGVFPPRG